MKNIVNNKLIKSSEELISMVLGLVIVVVIGFLIVNFISKRKGNISLPGMSSENISLEEGGKTSNEAKSGEYEVKKGDNLWNIAMEKYGDGFAWTKIAEANSLSNPGSIEIGQKLVMPEVLSSSETKTTITEESNYEVVAGDSLWKIATAKYGDGFAWTKIYEKNSNIISNPSIIEKGMVLVLPIL